MPGLLSGPMVFLAITVIYAGIMNVGMFFKRGDSLGTINGAVSIVLIVLVVITLLDSIRKWNELLKTDGPVGMNLEELSCNIAEKGPRIPS